MIVTRRVALLVSVALASLCDMTGAAAGSGVQLKAISSRVHAKGASLTIEASEPAAYVTTHPDPLTVVVDFRNVNAEGLANSVTYASGSPIARVMVESAATDVQVTRVRVALTEPVVHHVRSERNSVVVEFERPSAQAAADVLAARSRNTPDALQALARLETSSDGVVATSIGRAAQPAVAQAPAAPVQQPPASPPASQSTATRCGEGPYTGHPVSFDFQSADLRAVLRTFAEISGLNVVIDPKVTGSVDVALRDVPWDQALGQILRANQLGCLIDGTIVRVAPITVLAEEQKQQSALAQAQAEAGQLTTLTHQLSYAKGEDLVALFRSAQVLSARGQAFTDVRTNTLLITDLQDRLTTARELIDVLDRPQPQVEIEARIVQTSSDFARALGIQWGFAGRVDPALGNTTNLAFPNSGSVSGGVGEDDTAVRLGVPGASSAVRLALGSINGAFNLDVALSALERSGNARVLLTPRVSTQNNVEAEIARGEQIPYQTISNQTTTTTFRDAALVLRVTPQITAAGTVIMKISVDNGSRGPDAGTPPQPSILTQRANTTVMVSDGETTVIGGIYSTTETRSNDRTPGLSRIPFLKWFFKRDASSDANAELLIFITPRILKGVAQ